MSVIDNGMLGPEIRANVEAIQSRTPGGQANQYYIGVFGDSIGNNAFYTDGTSPDGLTPSAFLVDGAKNNNLRGWGYLSWISPFSLGRAQVIKSWARQTNGILAGGTTPAGVPLSVQVTQALADPAWRRINRVVIMIGTNDAFQNSGTVEANAAELIAQIARIKKPVDLLSTPPFAGGATVGNGMQEWLWLLQWRAMCKRIADNSNNNIRFVDTYSTVNKPTAAVDDYAAGTSYDTIHPNNVGAYKIADAYVASLYPTGLYGDIDVWPHRAFAGTTGANGRLDQGFSNPVFATTTGGTGTGTIASGLTVTNTAGASHSGSVGASTIPGSIGNMQTLDITSTAAGDGAVVLQSTVHAAGGTFAGVGDTVWAEALVRVNSGGIYPRNLRLLLNGFSSPDNYFATLFEQDAAKELALPFTATRTLFLRTPNIVVPSGVNFSNLQASFRPVFAGAGSCTIDIANFAVRRIKAGS